MKKVVCLASGGLDSIVCMELLRRTGVAPVPVFVDYGQLNVDMEYKSLIKYCNENSIEHINRFDFSNFGRIIRSGITDSALNITEDAFTPNRNLLFILLGSSIAAMEGVDRIVMGLLSEETCIFPDQTDGFITSAEQAISLSTGRGIKIELPLRQFSKSHVISLAKQLGVKDTYSCHRGGPVACGECISCREFVCDVPN